MNSKNIVAAKTGNEPSEEWDALDSEHVYRERFRLMIQNSNDSFVLLDADGNQFYLNEAGANVTGYSKEELLGPFDKVIHPEDLETVQNAFIKVCSCKDVIKVQYRHIHKSKNYIWMEAVGQNHLDNPAINAIVLNVRDITGLKENEALIKAQNEELHDLNRLKDELIIAESEKSEKLKELLEKRRKELASNALMLTHISNINKRILRELKNLRDSGEDSFDLKLNKIISEMSSSFKDIDWSSFQNRFEELQLDFFNKVGIRFPALSPAEQKMMAYIRLGFSSKEISALTHNTLESVHVARSRLRKKLGLSVSDNLTLFVSKL